MDNPADNPIRCGGSACSIPFRDAILVLFAPAFLWVALGVGTAIPMFQSSGWPATALLILAALAGLVSESSRLPAQNVLFAAAVIAVVTGAVHAVNLFSGIPFGPIIYTGASGPKYFATLPWFVPLIGIASILLSRGVARMILRPWRKTRLYGFRVIGLTVILVILLEAGMEVFASRTSGFWFWQPTKLPLDWGGVSLFRLLGGALVTLLVLVLITPLLIRKQPGEARVNYTALIVWTMLNGLFGTAALMERLWVPGGITLVGAVTVLAFAVRGARW